MVAWRLTCAPSAMIERSDHRSSPDLTMTHAESISRQIEHQMHALRSIRAALAETVSSLAASDTWDAREILLHLIGATKEIPNDLKQSIAGDAGAAAPRQTGGEYDDIPEVRTAMHAADALLRQLGMLAEAVHDLEDEELERPVTVMNADGHAIPNVPIGLIVRHALTEHFDEHMAQLREAVGPSQVN